ncbi:GNAT family N-acetyltransferase [Pseudonocardia acaciae]|uniref:GNAT family N-acetyltransferase n=1 Tax=Pseudonocardia acaciae TaxID=551276 RepID=UPI00048D31ED|nr:GNAT family protein [Pseudonocardia acaciae]
MVPTYRDGTVLLSAFTPDDVASHLAGEDDETARRFGWWPESSTEETVLRSFDDWAKSWANGGPIHTFAVRRQDTGELLGGCQLRKQDDLGGEVSYWTGAGQRGRGYARRALTLLTRHACGEGLTRLEAHIEADNPASQAVALAAGYTEESRFTDDGTLMIRYIWTVP